MTADMATGMISIVDADPELAELLNDDELERARHETLTRVQKLSTGDWDVSGALEPEVYHRGFMVAEGLMSREVDVLGRRAVELIGPSDVLRPWSWDEEGSHVQAEIGWRVLEPTKLAVLDHALVARLDPWPQLGVELVSRGTRRAHHLAVALAIVHHSRVEERLLLTLWHLAERWGRVTPTASSSRCRSATSAWPTSSAPTGPRSRRRWARCRTPARSAGATTATGSCMASRRTSCAATGSPSR
jgi:hypothetical protein